jgi:periplasmic copper chaperone A
VNSKIVSNKLLNIRVLGLIILSLSLYALSALALSTHQDKPLVSKTAPVIVVNAVMPKVPPTSRTAAIYLTLQNQSAHAIYLKGVSSESAHHLMFHQTIESNGVAKMQHKEGLEIPANGQLHFKPGGLHIMMMGLSHEKIAKAFKITLEFEGYADKTIEVELTDR